jgi:hypothetical protein
MTPTDSLSGTSVVSGSAGMSTDEPPTAAIDAASIREQVAAPTSSAAPAIPAATASTGQPGIGAPGEEMFARAVGLAEAPAARDRRGKKRGRAGARPVITAEDAARLANGAGPLRSTPGSIGPVADPVVDPSSRNASWLQRRRLRVRRTRRIIRHIDPWSVFKVSTLLYACLYVAVLIAGVLLWSAAVGSGVVGNIESFIEDVMSYELWEFQADEIFRGGAIIGVVLAVAGVAFNVLLAILFNLISDLVGGVRVTVLEEDGVPRSTTI